MMAFFQWPTGGVNNTPTTMAHFQRGRIHTSTRIPECSVYFSELRGSSWVTGSGEHRICLVKTCQEKDEHVVVVDRIIHVCIRSTRTVLAQSTRTLSTSTTCRPHPIASQLLNLRTPAWEASVAVLLNEPLAQIIRFGNMLMFAKNESEIKHTQCNNVNLKADLIHISRTCDVNVMQIWYQLRAFLHFLKVQMMCKLSV